MKKMIKLSLLLLSFNTFAGDHVANCEANFEDAIEKAQAAGYREMTTQWGDMGESQLDRAFWNMFIIAPEAEQLERAINEYCKILKAF